MPGFDVSSWYAIFAPAQDAGRDHPADARRHGRGAADPVIKSRLEQLGVTVVGSTPAELGAFLKSEMDKWGPVIKEAGIKGDE